MRGPENLPIEEVLGELCAALLSHGAAVLIAPPGAGKTTTVAPALLKEDWCTGKILLLSPRRVAARAAAERMAELMGEKAGDTVGYLTRLESKISAKTRIIVMTEAIFTARIVDDPELSGVSAVLFDEAHERHLDSDLGLALAIESRSVLREDLRLLVMSATIEGASFAALLDENAPIIESKGRAHPLTVKWLGSSPTQPLEEQMERAIMQAWREEEGDILAFLPGVRDIDRLYERLAPRYGDANVHKLHGQIAPADQRRAIMRSPDGSRRIVLATAIAESSLTLDGVRIVVDAGLSRVAEYDPVSGTTALNTRRASQASSAQRAGRAARQGPGVVYRLWEEASHAGRPAYERPEVECADLAPLMLSLAKWGTADPNDLRWISPLPAAAIALARTKLEDLGAVDGAGRITEWGKKIAAFPMEPVAASAVLHGARFGQAKAAAELVLLMQERGLGGQGEDLAQRHARFKGDRSARAEAARKMAARWAGQAEKLAAREFDMDFNPAIFFALAQKSNIAKRRGGSGLGGEGQFISAGGRGFTLDGASPLSRAEFLYVASAQGAAKAARITSAMEITAEELETYLGDLITRKTHATWNDAEGRVEARLERRLGAIILASGPDPNPDKDALVDILVEKSVENLGKILPEELIARAKFIGLDALSRQSLIGGIAEWLAPLLHGRRDLNLPTGKVTEALLNRLSWDERQRLDKSAPREYTSPAGSHHEISYTGPDAPCVEVRVQALFGLDAHPMIGNTPLLLKLTSPAGRPIQSTRDLPGFWRGSWGDVCKDMKGRYPKHRWPERPWEEKPSLKTKNAFARE